MTSLLFTVFFFFNQRIPITVVKKEDPPCCSPNQGLAISAQALLGISEATEKNPDGAFSLRDLEMEPAEL